MSNIVLLVAAGLIILIQLVRVARWWLRRQEHEFQLSQRPLCNRYYDDNRFP